jgi:hypothetical protein
MWFSWTYVAMVGLGPAVFSLPGAAAAALVLVVFVAVADSWVLFDFEPQPIRTRLRGTALIATPLIALVFSSSSGNPPDGRLVRLPSRRAASRGAIQIRFDFAS